MVKTEMSHLDRHGKVASKQHISSSLISFTLEPKQVCLQGKRRGVYILAVAVATAKTLVFCLKCFTHLLTHQTEYKNQSMPNIPNLCK